MHRGEKTSGIPHTFTYNKVHVLHGMFALSYWIVHILALCRCAQQPASSSFGTHIVGLKYTKSGRPQGAHREQYVGRVGSRSRILNAAMGRRIPALLVPPHEHWSITAQDWAQQQLGCSSVDEMFWSVYIQEREGAMMQGQIALRCCTGKLLWTGCSRCVGNGLNLHQGVLG
jgi:hypothetical protein